MAEKEGIKGRLERIEQYILKIMSIVEKYPAVKTRKWNLNDLDADLDTIHKLLDYVLDECHPSPCDTKDWIERCRKKGICYVCGGNGVERVYHMKKCDTFPFVETDYIEEIDCTLCKGTGDFTEQEESHE